MIHSDDFKIASSNQIEHAINEKIHKLRLSRNWTREKLAQEAGVSSRTIANLEEGRGITFNTVIRIMKAFGLQGNLNVLFPDTTIQPMELVETGGKDRKRERKEKRNRKTSPKWKWKE